jgi:8-oxo-dGTP diphosphatase
MINQRGEVLIARRPKDRHQGGLWEFPGGKLEPDEDVLDGLRRELREELGVSVQRARPLIRVLHDYPDRSVLLDVWRVESYEGAAQGREEQPVAWVSPRQLASHAFPAADRPVINAIRLPSEYLISIEPPVDWEPFLQGLQLSLSQGVRLVQLRARTLSAPRYCELARRCQMLCRDHGASLLLNADPAWAPRLSVRGVHLSARRLMALRARPLAADYWVAASCHNRVELEQAVRIGVDFAVLSPVRSTGTHPNALPLGWRRFGELVEPIPIPVYALGGMRRGDRVTAWWTGGQGIASISGLWREPR